MKKHKSPINQLMGKAKTFMDSFEYEAALKCCQHVLDQDCEHIEALETSGTILQELGHIDRAKQHFQRAVDILPHKGFVKYMSLGQLSEGAQAVKFFEKGLGLMLEERICQQLNATDTVGESETVSDRDVVNAHCSLAEIYLTDLCDEDGAEEKCQAYVMEAIATDPLNPEPLQLLASILLSQDRKQEAREKILESIDLWLPQLKMLMATDSGENDDPIEVCSLSFSTRIQTSKLLLEVGESESQYTDDDAFPSLATDSLQRSLDVMSEAYPCSGLMINTTKTEILSTSLPDAPTFYISGKQLACDVLELLLDEDTDNPDVWYLLGLANYLQGAEYVNNARHYLSEAKLVCTKVEKHFDLDLLDHIEQMLADLGSGEIDNSQEVNDNSDIDIESDGEVYQ